MLSWIQTHDLSVFCGENKGVGGKASFSWPLSCASELAINTKESSHGGSSSSKSPPTQVHRGPRGGSIVTPRGSSRHSCVLAEAPHRPAVCRAGRKGVCMVSVTFPPSFLLCSAIVNSGMCSRIHYGTGEHLRSNCSILLAPLFFSWRRCFVFSTRSEMVLVSWAKDHPPSCAGGARRRHRHHRG